MSIELVQLTKAFKDANKFMPRTRTRRTTMPTAIPLEDFSDMFPDYPPEIKTEKLTFKLGPKKTMPKQEPTIKQEEIFVDGKFRFYIEITTQGMFVDPFSNPPREYYVENTETKKRVPLYIALKIGEVENEDIPVKMFDFIHDYDENLD